MRRGFSLVEMLISLSIIALITSVIVFQYAAFDSRFMLKNAAYEVALTVRQAQRLALSIQGSRGSTVDTTYPYGVHFARSASSIQVFRDANRSDTYNTGDTLIETYSLPSGYTIKSTGGLCVDTSRDGSLSATECDKTSLDIMFERSLSFSQPSGDANFNPAGASAEIVLLSARGNYTRTIRVTETGIISVP